MGRFDALTTLDTKPDQTTPLLEKAKGIPSTNKPASVQTDLHANPQTSKDASRQTGKQANSEHDDRPHDDRKGHHYYTRNAGTGIV